MAANASANGNSSQDEERLQNESSLESNEDIQRAIQQAIDDELERLAKGNENAVPAPSPPSTVPVTSQGESPSSVKLQSRKRERCDDSEEEGKNEDSGDGFKRHDCAGSHANAEKPERQESTSDGNQSRSSSVSFPNVSTRNGLRPYRFHLRNRSSSSSSSSSTSNESTKERPKDASSSSSSSWHLDDSDSSEGSMVFDTVLHPRNREVDTRINALDSDDTWSLQNSDDSDSDDGADGNAEKNEGDEEEKIYQRCLSKEVPKHKWSVTKAVMNRQLGMHTRQQEAALFWQHCYGSLHCVKRLELMYKLDEHDGCVNAISFNQSGTRLASGSDDRKIIVWDWAICQSLLTYSSGHTSNVFQAKFLPMSGDNHIVSSARDGQVRLAVLSSTGECRDTRRLAHHRRPVNKIALLPETPCVFLSAGEDARVMAIDTRINKQSTLVTVRDSSKAVGLYSVDAHPLNGNEFCVCGVDYYIRIYDKRKIDVKGTPMKKFCPSHILGTNKYTNVTCALYNHDGTEILGSYNDESLYLFDARHSDGADFVHQYEGHRNSATVKSCDFYGPNSEYIMSGSDCGNIFFWDKNTEAIVQCMRGDEKGVVNALVGHPQFPILATSGLDSDVKIWVPSCEKDPEMKDLKQVVARNMKDRWNDQPYRIHGFGSIIADLNPARNFGVNERRRVRTYLFDVGRSSDDSDSFSEQDEHRIICPPS